MSDGQMSEALKNMAAHRAASHAVDRRGWTSQQWADDAKRLMSDLDGSVSSLLNGHVLGLIAARDAAVIRAEQAEQAMARVRDEREAIHEDLRQILLALRLGDHARPYSSHEVVQREVLPTIRRALDGTS